MRCRILVAALTLGMCAGCADPEPAPAPPVISPISGAQLDTIQRNLRDAGLARAAWANVTLSDDDTRVVVHARVDGLDGLDGLGSEEARGRYCHAATTVMEAGLHDGQRIEIYLVKPDEGVFACR